MKLKGVWRNFPSLLLLLLLHPHFHYYYYLQWKLRVPPTTTHPMRWLSIYIYGSWTPITVIQWPLKFSNNHQAPTISISRYTCLCSMNECFSRILNQLSSIIHDIYYHLPIMAEHGYFIVYEDKRSGVYLSCSQAMA